MMICPVCNHEVESNTRFCPNCGAQLEFPHTAQTDSNAGYSNVQDNQQGEGDPHSAYQAGFGQEQQGQNAGQPGQNAQPNYGQPGPGYNQPGPNPSYAQPGPNPSYGQPGPPPGAQPGPGYYYCKHCGQPLQPGAPNCVNCGAPVGAGTYYCPNCGRPAAQGASVCTGCGSLLNPGVANPLNPPKSKLVAGLLGIFLGLFGVHNFYLGFTEKAVIQLILTIVGIPLSCIVVGVFMILGASIWGLVEGIMILTGSIPADAKGVPLGD